MPYYDFICTKCGKHFEEYKSYDQADEPEICPECKGEARRIFEAPEVVFHGSGFYSTDHMKGSKGE